MLSLYPLKNAKEAGHYYMEQDNYYLSEKDPLEISYWQGKGAAILGLTGAVKSEDFLNMLEGKLPNGDVLGIILNKDGKRQHRPGTDLTFSAPKSISLIGLVGRDERLIKAHEEAVKLTIAHIEKLAAEARLTVNGETIYEKTGNLTAALFLHTTSRTFDANLHTHAIILNATQRQDGLWRALSSRRQNDKEHLYNGFREFIYDNQHYLGLFYNATLAKKTTELGFDIEIKDKYGNFEIKGLSKEYIEASSTRRKEIKEQQQKLGLNSAKSAEIANHETRQPKVAIDQESLRALWDDMAKQHQVDFKALIETSKQQGTGVVTSQNELPICDNAIEAVNDALSHLSRFRVKISHADLVRMAFVFGSGLIEHGDIEHTIDHLLKTQALLGEKYQTYTSSALLKKEEDFVQFIKKENAHSAKIHILEKSGVSADIFKEKSQIQVVDIKNFGAEKQLIQELVRDADHNNLNIYVLSQSKYQCDFLKNDATRDTSSFIKWFKSLFADEIVHTVSSFSHKYQRTLDERFSKKDRNDLIVVHDAQKLAFEDIEHLSSLAASSNSKLILLNHQQSLDGYRAGSPIKILKETGIKTHHHLGNAHLLKAEIIETHSPQGKAIQQFVANNNVKDQKEVIVATSKKEQDELTQAIRHVMKAQGQLANNEKEISVLSTNQLSNPQKKHLRFYREGDLLVFNAFTKQEQSFSVVSKEEGSLKLINEKGQLSNFSIKDVQAFEVYQNKTIALSCGDKIILEKPFQIKNLRFDRGQQLEVTSLSQNSLHLKCNNKVVEINNDELKNAFISHDYVKRLSQINQSYDKAIVCAKPFQVSKEFLNEVSLHTKSIDYYCLNKKEASARFDAAKTSWTIRQSIDEQKRLVERELSSGKEVIYGDLMFLSEAIAKGRNLNSEDIARQAIAFATAKCAEREAAFSHVSLLTHAMMFSLGKNNYSELEAVLHEKIKEGKLIHLDTHWTTNEAKALEKEVIRDNLAHQNTMEAIIKNADELNQLNPNLTKGQKSAVILALTNTDRFISIQGLAGVGKTTMTKEIQKFAEHKNIAVYGLTPTHKARQELSAQGIKSDTIDSFLLNNASYPPKSLFIVDETSMVSNKQYRELQKKALEFDGRLIYAGDITQLQSLEAGIPHELTITSKTQKTAFMEDIIRQNPNPDLKEAVLYASQMKLEESLEKVKKINPQDYIQRKQSFSYDSQVSIKEIPVVLDENKKNPSYEPIYKAIAEDYLSRTKEHRSQTLIVAPANADRYEIELLVRSGLKQTGEIDNKDIQVNRYLPKDMHKVDMLYAKSYEVNDIIRFDKTYSVAKRGDYFKITGIDCEKNELTCMHEGIEYKISPHELAHKAKMSVYVEVSSVLSKGDRIRIKKTQKEANLLANTEYVVSSLNSDTLKLSNKDGELLLNRNDHASKHWDYAYTNTAYSIQGGTDNFVIGLMLSDRQKATNHRSYEIIISRAKSQATLYTEDYAALKKDLTDFKKQDEANKKSALLMEKKYHQQKQKEKSLKDIHAEKCTLTLETNTEPNLVSPAKSSHQNKARGFIHQEMSAKDIEARLALNMESLCLALLGEPNRNLSNKTEYRYGAKGSLSINLNKGLWKNFETEEAGNALGLIKSVHHFSDFKEVLAFAKEFLGGYQVIIPKSKKESKVNEQAKEMQEHIKKKEKVMEIVGRSLSVKDTLAETYLKQTRGLSHFDEADIRFVEHLETYHGKKKAYVPALVAIARDEKGAVNNIEVIKLNPNNARKDEKSDPVKQSFGRKNGCYVELNKAYQKEKTYVTEGVETGLSIVSVDNKARVVTVLGKGNFKNIKHLNLGKEVVLCVDNDGKDTYKTSLIIDALDRLEKEGKKVSVIMPKKEGHDLNDVLLMDGKEALKSIIKNEITPSEFKKMHDQNVTNLIKETHNNPDEKITKKTYMHSIERQISQEKIKDFMKQEMSISTINKLRNLEREL
ncbi:MAG: conjugative transfer relaxase/helicase TraI [Legionella sp. 40-6]|nr:MAG: conjugative transfer relaxase/helicase TraI [Legionella sp. 40-6]